MVSERQRAEQNALEGELDSLLRDERDALEGELDALLRGEIDRPRLNVAAFHACYTDFLRKAIKLVRSG
jgi:hypothetical protein